MACVETPGSEASGFWCNRRVAVGLELTFRLQQNTFRVSIPTTVAWVQIERSSHHMLAECFGYHSQMRKGVFPSSQVYDTR